MLYSVSVIAHQTLCCDALLTTRPDWGVGGRRARGEGEREGEGKGTPSTHSLTLNC
jgi:hypothetical protein